MPPHEFVLDQRHPQSVFDGHLTGEPRVAEPLGQSVVPVVRGVFGAEPDPAGGTQSAAAAVSPLRQPAVRRQFRTQERVPERLPRLGVDFGRLPVVVDSDSRVAHGRTW